MYACLCSFEKLKLNVCLSYFSGSIIRKMVLDRQHLGVTKSRCIVWGVAFLSDGTVISVDSVGKVQLWDSATGTLVKSHLVANADVQSIAVADVSMVAAQVFPELTVLLPQPLSS
jgi:hypothetical protein